MKSVLNKLEKIETQEYARKHMHMDRLCANQRTESYFIVAHNSDPKYEGTKRYFTMPSNLSTVEVKLRSRKVLNLSADTPVNLMH